MQENCQRILDMLKTDEEQNGQILGRSAKIKELCQKAKENLLQGHKDVALGLINEIQLCACWIDALESYDVASATIKREFVERILSKAGFDDDEESPLPAAG